MLAGELIGIMDSIVAALAESSLICSAENSCGFFSTNITLDLHSFTLVSLFGPFMLFCVFLCACAEKNRSILISRDSINRWLVT